MSRSIYNQLSITEVRKMVHESYVILSDIVHDEGLPDTVRSSVGHALELITEVNLSEWHMRTF